jgi:hypothetical protein
MVTSAASVAAENQSTHAAVTVPSLQTGTRQKNVTVQPWNTDTSTSRKPSTSAPPLTAPTTTRLTLTFSSLAPVTRPTIAKPSLGATPPPDCYPRGDCPSLDSAQSDGGTVLVVSPPDGTSTVAILRRNGQSADSLYLGPLPSPSVTCTGSTCLVQGSSSGLVFADLIAVGSGRLSLVSDQMQSFGPMRLGSSSSGQVMVTGRQSFDEYGLPPSESPMASTTWVLGSSGLKRTGCGAPVLYGTPSVPGDAVTGPCSGTPRISGLGPASAHPILPLGGFSTPSGNIRCALVSSTKLACTIKQHDFTVATCNKPIKQIPKSLRGVRIVLGKTGGASHDDCLGYTLIGSPATNVSYGRMAAGGGFVCDIESGGVSCTAPSGRGFTVSTSGITTR